MAPQKAPISEDMRKLVVRKVSQEGQKVKQVSESLGIAVSTIRHILKNYETYGTFTSRKRGGNQQKKLTEEVIQRLQSLIDDNIQYTLQDIVDNLGIDVHAATVWKWLKKLNYSWKLTRPVPERRNDDDVKERRVTYVYWYQSLPLRLRCSNVVYLDESPFHLNIIRSHAWSRVGETRNPVVSTSRGRNVTMILAINANNVVLSEAIVGTGVNGQVFEEFLINLINILGTDEEYTLLMDNVRFHHVNKEFAEAYPYNLVYLPPYSPFLNPCEETFSKI